MVLLTAAKEIDHIIRTFTVRLGVACNGPLDWDTWPLSPGYGNNLRRCRDVTTVTHEHDVPRKVLEAWPAHIETRPERRRRPSTCRHPVQSSPQAPAIHRSARETSIWDVTMELGKMHTTQRGCAWDMQEPGLRDAAMVGRRLQAAGLPRFRWGVRGCPRGRSLTSAKSLCAHHRQAVWSRWREFVAGANPV
jgi:hypothetical protein